MQGRVSTLAVCAALAALAAPSAVEADGRHGGYLEVTITNITRGQILSPPVVVSHGRKLAPIFQLGQPASPELAAVAEDAAADDLIDALAVDPATKDVQLASGPVPPGQSVTVVVKAPRHGGYVSALGMLVTTNDAFFAVQGLAVPRRGSASHSAPAYDAGSETNNEDCAFIPGPPCGNANVRDMTAAEGFVHIHAGIHGGADLVPADHDWRNPVAVVSVRRAHH